MKSRFAFLAFAGLVSAANATEFSMTVTDLGGQPLSPVFYAASDSTFDEFTLGNQASLGIKHIAEMGDATSMLGIAAGAGSAVGAYGLCGSSPITTGNSATTTFMADSSHPYFSFATMLGKTNDGFLGESVSSMGLMLFSGSTPQSIDYIVTGERAWDAGTELNTQNAADLAFLGGNGNPQELQGNAYIRQHAGIIPGVGDSWQLMPAWGLGDSLAEVQIKAVPEPGSMFGLASGVLGFLAIIRRRRAMA